MEQLRHVVIDICVNKSGFFLTIEPVNLCCDLLGKKIERFLLRNSTRDVTIINAAVVPMDVSVVAGVSVILLLRQWPWNRFTCPIRGWVRHVECEAVLVVVLSVSMEFLHHLRDGQRQPIEGSNSLTSTLSSSALLQKRHPPFLDLSVGCTRPTPRILRLFLPRNKPNEHALEEFLPR